FSSRRRHTRLQGDWSSDVCSSDLHLVLALLVASMYFPTRVTALIAIFEIQHDLGLINVTLGLILPYVALNLALSVFIMRGMFERSEERRVGKECRYRGGPYAYKKE